MDSGGKSIKLIHHIGGLFNLMVDYLLKDG